MAKKPQANTKNSKKTTGKNHADFWGLSLMPWVESAQSGSTTAEGPKGRLVVLGKRAKLAKYLDSLAGEVPDWQLQRFQALGERCDESVLFTGTNGPLWLVTPRDRANGQDSHHGLLTQSPYARARDLVGALVAAWEALTLMAVTVECVDCTPEQIQGAVVGLELGAYSFKSTRVLGERKPRSLPRLNFSGAEAQMIAAAAQIGLAINIARQLTNLPPAELQPQSYAASVAALFAATPTVDVAIWDGKKLAAENMGLLLGVGGGAKHGPQLVRLSYRPKSAGAGKKNAPQWAVVGKGVTFDSGGLDIKSAAGMRLMKKDMAGSATLVGTLWALVQSNCPVACDFYLSLAENAIDAAAFHPSDVLVSRSGQTVEIHNTDAEGRLVMADALTLAIENSDATTLRGVIDVATLTGAIKVGLGADIPGLFANDDKLADNFLSAAQLYGERMWRMPLVEEYNRELNSNAADMVNAASSGYGGAITAALFLKRFVQDKPWLHLDIYGWTDMPQGGYREVGATGQGVQALTAFIKESAFN